MTEEEQLREMDEPTSTPAPNRESCPKCDSDLHESAGELICPHFCTQPRCLDCQQPGVIVGTARCGHCLDKRNTVIEAEISAKRIEEEGFVNELLAGRNPTRAVAVIRPDVQRPGQRAQALLANPDVQLMLRERLAERRGNADRIYDDILDMTAADFGIVLENDGRFDFAEAKARGVTKFIKKMKIIERRFREPDGTVGVQVETSLEIVDVKEFMALAAKIAGLEKRKAMNPFDQKTRAEAMVTAYMARKSVNREQAIDELSQGIPNIRELVESQWTN